jgi:hypothetical protein
MIKESNFGKFHRGGIKISTKNDKRFGCPCSLCAPYKSGTLTSRIEELTKKELNNKEQRLTDLKFNFYDISDELLTIMLNKNEDYGPDNILKSPGGAINGLNVRLFDKVARLNNLISNNKIPNNESVRDTLIDIANYAIIGLLVVDDNWK